MLPSAVLSSVAKRAQEMKRGKWHIILNEDMLLKKLKFHTAFDLFLYKHCISENRQTIMHVVGSILYIIVTVAVCRHIIALCEGKIHVTLSSPLFSNETKYPSLIRNHIALCVLYKKVCGHTDSVSH